MRNALKEVDACAFFDEVSFFAFFCFLKLHVPILLHRYLALQAKDCTAN